MKKLLCVFLCVILLSVLTVPALAEAGPVITLQPQNPNYPEYSTASYTVKATGNNLQAIWYLEYEGNTYNLSDNTNGIEPWEGYAGETYGAVQEDDNTFVYFFGGIGHELDGAKIWCVIEDGHYDVASQKAIISIGNPNMPPVIEQFPAQVTVTKGQSTDLRCVALAPGNTQLSFAWYETATGQLENIQIMENGLEEGDYITPDTGTVGTRYYVCMVRTNEGGIAYSSVVPVTVTQAPAATEPTSQTQPATQPTETTAATQAPQQTEPVGTEPVGTEPAPQQTGEELPWWALVLIIVLAAGLGACVTIIIVGKSKKTEK